MTTKAAIAQREVLHVHVDDVVAGAGVDCTIGKTAEEIAAWEAWRVARVAELQARIAASRAAAARFAELNLIALARGSPKSGETNGMRPRDSRRPPRFVVGAWRTSTSSKKPSASSAGSNASWPRRGNGSTRSPRNGGEHE